MEPRNENILLVVGLIGSVVAAVAPYLVVPRFVAMFSQFGFELPLATRLFVHYHSALLLLPVLVGLAWLFWPQRANRAVAACAIGVSGVVVTIPLMVLSLYLPFSQLTATA